MGGQNKNHCLLRSRFLLVEPSNADLWRLDVMAYIRNCSIRHSASFRVIYCVVHSLRLAHARAVSTRFSFPPPH